MRSQVYFDGDYYLCVENAQAGETPATHPTKWHKLSIPENFQAVVAQRAYSLLLPGESGQNQRRVMEQQIAQAMLLDLRGEEAAEHSMDRRPEVMTR